MAENLRVLLKRRPLVERKLSAAGFALMLGGIWLVPLPLSRAEPASETPSSAEADGPGTNRASYASEAAKAARRAADEARAAALEAKAFTAPAIQTPAATAQPITPLVAPANAAKAAPAQASASPTGKPPTGPKIVLTPAKKLFGAAKTAANMPARSYGGYAKGCVAGAKALAVDGPAWQAMRLSRNRNWGHPKLIALLERFATEMKTKENWPGLLIGDLSQPRGGPMLTGHKSHQVGLDADIWFKPKPEKTLTRSERETYEPLLLAKDNGTTIITENWNEGFIRLVRRAANYSEVERIFVHPAIKKEFCKTTDTDRSWLKKVRPMWLHNYHFHVRIGCPTGSGTCEHQAAVNSQDDGCGKELDDWIKLVSAPPKPAPVPAPPPVPRPPKPEMNLEQLPVDCREVLTSGEPKDSAAVKAVAEIKTFHEQEKAEKAAKLAEAKAAAAAKAAEKSAKAAEKADKKVSAKE